jgi:hypothetical protein
MASVEPVRTQALSVRRMALPPALVELGVVMGVDPETGRELVIIPPTVREHVNVLDPVSSFAQSRPDWSPAVRIVQLDPDPDNGPHFYKQVGNKLAPTKQALELLSRCAGALYTRTRRMKRDELSEGEALGYIATIGMRRPDGSIEELERSRTFVTEAELEEIRDAVTRGGKFGAEGEPRWEAEVRKRWLKEQKDAPAKTESKAVNRAIRAALQIPHGFAPARAALPFIVVGFNFTPDQSDPEVRRMLTAAGLNAANMVYGPTRSADLELEASDTDTPPDTVADDSPEDRGIKPSPEETAGTADSELGQQAGSSSDETPPAEGGPAPGTGEPPPPEPEPAAQDERKAMALGTATKTVVPFGRWRGFTVMDVHKGKADRAAEPQYLAFLAGESSDFSGTEGFAEASEVEVAAVREAARVYAQRWLPELLEAKA